MFVSYFVRNVIYKGSRIVDILVETVCFETGSYAEWSKAKKIWKYVERNMFFYINEYNQKYFPCVSKTFPVLQQNSLCFPCLEKVRSKFPVFPVPWPPCSFLKDSIFLVTIRCRGPSVMIYNSSRDDNLPFTRSKHKWYMYFDVVFEFSKMS